MLQFSAFSTNTAFNHNSQLNNLSQFNLNESRVSIDSLNDTVLFGKTSSLEKKKIVIVGNGLAGVAVARGLNKQLKKHPNLAEVTILGRDDQYVFKPMLPDALNSHKASIPMSEAFKGKKNRVSFIQTEVTGVSINPDDKVVQTEAGSIAYDYLVMAVGGKTNYFNTEGAEEFTLSLSSREDLEQIKTSVQKKLDHALQCEADSDEQKKALSFVIVGAGATGVELAFELNVYVKRLIRENYPELNGQKPQITIVEAMDDILPGFTEAQKNVVKELLDQFGIEVRYKTSVKKVTDSQGLVAADKSVEPPKIYNIDTVDPVWVTGVMANELSTTLDVERLARKEQIVVNQYLELPDRPDIYVIGDVAAAPGKVEGQFLPSTGQVAEQQGTYVAESLMEKLKEENDSEGIKPFSYKDKGLMLSAGPRQGFVDVMDKLLLKGRLASKLRQAIYKRKLMKG